MHAHTPRKWMPARPPGTQRIGGSCWGGRSMGRGTLRPHRPKGHEKLGPSDLKTFACAYANDKEFKWASPKRAAANAPLTPSAMKPRAGAWPTRCTARWAVPTDLAKARSGTEVHENCPQHRK